MVGSRTASERQPIFGAAVPLARPVKLDREKTFGELSELVGLAGARVRLIEDGGGRGFLAGLRGQAPELKCEIAGVRLVLRMSNKPLCSATAMHSFINPSVWRGALGGMTSHKAHMLIAEDDGAGGSSRDALFDRATAVTLATAAVANMAEAQGVIWLPARNALPMGTFGSEMERFIDGQAPLQFWVRWQILPPPLQQEKELGQLIGEALKPGVATIGMAAFMGAEIIAPPSSCERDVMLDHVFALASAVIDDNAELKDGAVYGKPDGIMVRLNLRKSGQYSERPYWEVLPRPAPASKSQEPGGLFAPPEDDTPPERHLRLIVSGK